MEKKVLISFPDKCTGCRTCEIVCGNENKKSCIKILKNELFDVNIPVVSMKCRPCAENPVCIEFCTAKALKLVSYQEAVMLRKYCRIGIFPVPLAF